MKFIKYKYIVTVLILFSVCGCSQEEFVNGGDSPLTDGVKVSLNIAGTPNSMRNSLGNSESIIDNESTISNLYLLFYEEGTAIRDQPMCFIAKASLNTYGRWSANLALPGLLANQTYNVYAFANISEAIANKLSSTVTRGIVKGLTEELLARQDDLGRTISFSTTTTYTGGVDKLIIDVKRTVAKLQVGIDMSGLAGEWHLESVKVLGEMQKTSYIGTNPTTPRVSSYNAFNVTGKDSVYYYLYENAKSANDADQVKLQINIANAATSDIRSYTAIVNKKGASEIVRNKIYKSKILLIEGSEPIELLLDIVPWDHKYINADVPNVYLNLLSNTVDLSSTGYGYLNFKSNAKEIKVNWKDNNGLLVNTLKGPSTVIAPIDELGNYRINFSMFSVKPDETKDMIILNVGNLSKEVTVVKELSRNYLELLVLPMESNPDSVYIFDPDPNNETGIKITLKTTNFVKPWYILSVSGVRVPDGSFDTSKGMLLEKGYLSNGLFVLNMMEQFQEGFYPAGFYECLLRIGYTDEIGKLPNFREHRFYIEKLN